LPDNTLKLQRDAGVDLHHETPEPSENPTTTLSYTALRHWQHLSLDAPHYDIVGSLRPQ
jgi:hypothetical protein